MSCGSIFLDPTGRRARVTNVTVSLLIVLLLSASLLLLVAILRNPRLPVLESNRPAAAAERGSPADESASLLRTSYSALRDRTLPAGGVDTLRFAFVEAADKRSLNSLRSNAAKLDGILPNWIEILNTRHATPVLSNPERTSDTIAWIEKNAAHLSVFPIVTTDLAGSAVALLVTDASRRQKLIATLMALVERHRFSGLTFDLWQLPQSSQAAYAGFLSEVRFELNRRGKKLILQFPSDDIDQQHQELVRFADYTIANLYLNVTAPYGGAPASQGWFEENLAITARLIGNHSLIIAIGSYARDCSESGLTRILSVQKAWDLLATSNGETHFEATTLNPYFDYRDEQGTQHRVWLLDGVTAFNHARAAFAERPAAIAIWKLGLEEEAIWSVVGRHRQPDGTALEALRRPLPSINALERGSGAALTVKNSYRAGERELDFDAARGLIMSEHLSVTPIAVIAENWGVQPEMRVALTFDDGPDRNFTPRILDILKERRAPAAFFIVGRNALQNPAAMQRIYDEGHEIGNHTFSHPNLKTRPAAEIRVELNTTQRVIESQLGVRTVLFRAPYADDNVEGDPQSLRALRLASSLGYVSVNVTLDPNDWASPTPRQITDRILTQLSDTENKNGHIILLHDAGGNRRPTIDALPQIIDEIRDRGYTFVPVHQLIGKTRDEVMPRANTEGIGSVALAAVTGFGLGSLSWLADTIPTVAIVATALGLMRLAFIILYAFRHRRIERARRDVKWRPRSLTVLVPAFNEEKVICKTIRSLMASRHRKFDIVVIDDGSTDGTADAVRREFWRTRRVRVFKTPNAGKAEALNFGLRQTNADVVIAIDADTVFGRDAIEMLVRHFHDPCLGAVAGRAVVGNEVSMMARFQSLEYVTSQNLDRRAFESFNAIGVVPGAIGAWRRSALIDAGGFPSDTLAEDADATIALERAGWRVLYEPAAFALTEAPETVRTFLKQRFRWMYGTLQVAFKHRDATLSPVERSVGLITIPNILIFQFAFTLLAPLMDLLLGLTLLVGFRELLLTGGADVPDSLIKVSAYCLLFQSIDGVLAAIGLGLNGEKKRWSLLPLILVQRFCYRQLLYVVAIRTLLAAIRGQFVGWGKLLRTGNVLESLPRLPVPAALPA